MSATFQANIFIVKTFIMNYANNSNFFFWKEKNEDDLKLSHFRTSRQKTTGLMAIDPEKSYYPFPPLAFQCVILKYILT